jgi:hypothetical protein
MAPPDLPTAIAAAPAKVVGLGAPISVWIHLDLIEIPALTAAIRDELVRYSDGGSTAGEWTDHTNELQRMLADVEQAENRRATGRFDVVWPTVLAHAVIGRAVAHAQRLLAAAAHEQLAHARLALAAAERTHADFNAVDCGGRDAIWL